MIKLNIKQSGYVDAFFAENINFPDHLSGFSYQENEAFHEIKSSFRDCSPFVSEHFPVAGNIPGTLHPNLVLGTEFLASLRCLKMFGRFVSDCRKDPEAAGISAISVQIFADILADIQQRFIGKYGLSDAVSLTDLTTVE